MIYDWTPITEPPTKTGVYIVAHRGQVAEACHFLAQDRDWIPHTVLGWRHLPDFRPTHWMEILWPE